MDIMADYDNKIPYAGVVARVIAYLVDCLVLFAGLLVWQAALYVFNPIVRAVQSGQQPSSAKLHLWVFATATIPFLFYFALTQSSARQATPGMRLLKLKLISVGGGPVRFGQALLRAAVLLIPFELNHAVMFHLTPRDGQPPTAMFWLGYIIVWALIALYIAAIPLTRRRQSVHDLLTGTAVVAVSQRAGMSGAGASPLPTGPFNSAH